MGAVELVCKCETCRCFCTLAGLPSSGSHVLCGFQAFGMAAVLLRVLQKVTCNTCIPDMQCSSVVRFLFPWLA